MVGYPGTRYPNKRQFSRRLYLVAYDIASAARRRAVLRQVRSHATDGQRSLHECWMTPSERDSLVDELNSVLEPGVDRLFMLRLDPRQAVSTLGVAVPPDVSSCLYLG